MFHDVGYTSFEHVKIARSILLKSPNFVKYYANHKKQFVRYV